jgi:DNA-binding NarL/FixJ family response regulator
MSRQHGTGQGSEARGELGSRFERGSPPAQPRVLVVDEHPVSRAGLSSLLRAAGLAVVGEAHGAEPGAAMVQRVRPDVIIVDLGVPGPSGLDAIRRIVSSAPRSGVVVLVDDDEFDVLRALAAGVCGCILKDTPVPGILAAIRAAARGNSVVSPRIASKLVRQMEQPAAGASPSVELSPREREVLALLARGWDNARIAAALYVSRATVKHHISSILKKLRVDNRIQAAVHAVQQGLLDGAELDGGRPRS